MLKTGKIKIIHILTFFVFPAVTLLPQNTGCLVMMPSVSGIYTGDCKNGLAHGKGTAQGTDKYTGQFRKGLPHGEGVYTWADGTSYQGQFRNGMKEGKGKMNGADSTYSGIWKEDKYVGKELIPAYKVTRSVNVTRSSFYRTEGAYNAVRIKLMRNGVENAGIISADITHTSGEEFTDGSNYGIQQPVFPLNVKVRFKATSAFGTARFDVFFDFTINQPGTWEVRISY